MALVYLEDRDRARRAAMMKETTAPEPEALTLALESLNCACKDLDDAVLAMPNAPGDDVMATPSLMTLLLRVVAARRQVRRLELAVRAS